MGRSTKRNRREIEVCHQVPDANSDGVITESAFALLLPCMDDVLLPKFNAFLQGINEEVFMCLNVDDKLV